MPMYRPLRPAGTLDVPIRQGRYRLHVWEPAEAHDEPAPPAPSGGQEPVSYTHLTLPTIYYV